MKAYLTLIAVALTLSLSACGIKPGNVQPPSGEDKSQFPRTYPAPDGY